MTPLVSPVTFFNTVGAGTVSAAGAVMLSFTRTNPNVGSASFLGTLAGNVLAGQMSAASGAAGTFFTATGTTTCSGRNTGHYGDHGDNDNDD